MVSYCLIPALACIIQQLCQIADVLYGRLQRLDPRHLTIVPPRQTSARRRLAVVDGLSQQLEGLVERAHTSSLTYVGGNALMT